MLLPLRKKQSFKKLLAKTDHLSTCPLLGVRAEELLSGPLGPESNSVSGILFGTPGRSSMDRASVFGTEGWGFESLRPGHFVTRR